jgi:hypothetical protein
MPRILIHLGCAVLIVGLFAPPAAIAQSRDRRTYFTFSGPVSLPGVTLPAGKYLFRVVDISTRQVVQVLSADGKKSYTVFFAVPAERLDPPQAPEVRFLETALDVPAAIDTWWYPGDRTGFEFIYPKRQARLLARGSGRPVLTTQPETVTPPETRTAELARITPTGEQAEPTQVVPAPPGVTVTGEMAPQYLDVPEWMVQTHETLPKTASALPIVALLGVAFLVGGAVLRSWRSLRQ